MRPQCLSAAKQRATANIGKHHRIRTATAETIDDDTPRRHIHDTGTAQAIAASDIDSLTRIAATAIKARRRPIVIRRWRPMPARTDINIHTLRKGKIRGTRQRGHGNASGDPQPCQHLFHRVLHEAKRLPHIRKFTERTPKQ